MKSPSESLKAVGRWMKGPLSTKNKTKIGLWKVKTLSQLGKLVDVENSDVLGKRVEEEPKTDNFGTSQLRSYAL